MKTNSFLNTILFLDIETVPQYPSFEDCPETVQKHWEHKAALLRKHGMETTSELYSRAGIYAEFGKIVCISTGRIIDHNLEVLSFADHEEYKLLSDFACYLGNNEIVRLCAHNGKEFDFPYLSRRMVINAIHLPVVLNNAGKKPWEMNHIDTMELWKFGDFKNYTPLALLTSILGFENPKDDIDGSQVANVYWRENNLQRIVTYCEKDIIALTNVYLRMSGMPGVSAKVNA